MSDLGSRDHEDQHGCGESHRTPQQEIQMQWWSYVESALSQSCRGRLRPTVSTKAFLLYQGGAKQRRKIYVVMLDIGPSTCVPHLYISVQALCNDL